MFRHCKLSMLLLWLLSRFNGVLQRAAKVPKINDGGDGKDQIQFCTPPKMTPYQRAYVAKRVHMLLKINMARHRHKIRQKRGTVGFGGKIWNNIPVRINGKTYYMVPYTVLSYYDQKSADVLLDAMRAIHNGTCIHFDRINTPEKQQYYRDDDYIAIVNDKGCHSVIGRHRGKNLLTLYVSEEREMPVAETGTGTTEAGTGEVKKVRETCMKRRIVMHELLHLLGLHHEHQRRARTGFIDIHMDNVREGKERNFHVENNEEDWGFPYDFDSIMNYRYNQFARNVTEPVISVHNGEPKCQERIGTHQHASDLDLLLLNMLYNCDGVDAMVDAFITRNFKPKRRLMQQKKLLRKMERQFKKEKSNDKKTSDEREKEVEGRKVSEKKNGEKLKTNRSKTQKYSKKRKATKKKKKGKR